MANKYYKLSHKATRLFEKQKYSKALALYEKLTELYPTQFFAWFNFGLTLSTLKNYSLAEKAYARALALRPDDSPTLNELALALFHQQKYDLAETKIQNALICDSTQATYHNTLGIILFNQEAYTGAAKSFKRACELDPLFPEAWFNLSDTYSQLGDPIQAAVAQAEYIKLNR